MPFIATNISPDKVKFLPNDATKEKVMEGYKNVRTHFIDFVKKYNTSKTAGNISLNPIELAAMNKLHNLWKTATPDKTERGGNYFFDMEEIQDQLNSKFLEDPEDVVSAAWNDYIKLHSDWLGVILHSSATMFELQL